MYIKRAKPHHLIQRLPLTQARNSLGAVVKRVHLNKEYVILEKDGIPLAGVMDIDEFEDYLELQDPKSRADIHRSTAEYRAGKSRPAEDFLKELRQEARKAKRRRSA
jgi:PHD/YefM family antitoxin component YafN of YafNO toxin-antitoxin module